MNISYEYYKIFCYAARYGSISRAAAALMINQPNVTRTIRNLEAELGCKLFIRTNRGVTLTPEGERLYAHVRTAVEQITAGEEEIARSRSLQSGVIAVGASEIALRCFLLPILGGYHRKYPGVKLRIFNYSTPEAISALRMGLVDIAVVTTPTGALGSLRAEPIAAVCETAVCGESFAHLAAAPISLRELSAYPIISLSPETMTHACYRDLFAKHGLPFSPDIEAETADLILPMVENDLGIGFVPEPFLETAGSRVIRLTVKEALPQRKICCIRNTGHAESIAVRELRDMMVK